MPPTRSRSIPFPFWVFILVFAVSAAWFVTSRPSPTQADLAEADVVSTVRPSIVQVLVEGRQSSSAGSGVKVEAGILTNAHVVENAVTVQILTSAGQRAAGKVLRVDSQRDLALLETGHPLPSLELEMSRQQRQGDVVLALGFPRPDALGVGGDVTVTRGLLSRTSNLAPIGPIVQTDAPLNPGNSGGALVNLRGKLIGVTTGKLEARGPATEGLNFAVASEVVQSFLAQAPTPRPTSKPTTPPVAPLIATSTPPPPAATSAPPTSTPVPSPSATPPPLTLAPAQILSPAPTPDRMASPTQPAPVVSRYVYVANTDGQGVYIRRTPAPEDRLVAVPEGIRLGVTGQPVIANGRTWVPVQDPAGHTGFVPGEYISDIPPTPRPTSTPAPTSRPAAPAVQGAPAIPTRDSAASPRSESTARLRLESEYVSAAFLAEYSREAAEREARTKSDADLSAAIQRFRRESEYISAAFLADYPRSEAAQRSRSLTEAQLQAGVKRYRLESEYISNAFLAGRSRASAAEQARRMSDTELIAAIGR